MNTITIIVIVVIVFLTALIFGLTLLAYLSCIKAYKVETDSGKHDDEICKEYGCKKKKKGLVGIILSYVTLSALLGLFITGVVYKASGENLTINNKTVLVIKSGSMSEFYDEGIAVRYNYDTSLQFDVGDMCFFEKLSPNDELVEGQVYGYKNKNNIITHRLKSIKESGYEFQGDNNGISDYEYTGTLITRDKVLYHYTGKKVPAIGSFVLYAQSYFGLWSILCITGVAVSSEFVFRKINNINKERYEKIGGNENEK